MACSVIRTWTLSKLVGAFLDLFIAYMMLCGSTIAYFASKFLGIFGLNLPCPCNGLFGNPNEAYCVQRLLVEYPVARISSVNSSVKSKFPYDLICDIEQNCQGKMNRCVSFDDRPLELEGEASCGSASDARKPHETGSYEASELVPKVAAARFDLKRKGIAYQRPKSGLRRRRKVADDYGTMSSAASYGPCGYNLQETPKSSFNFHKQINSETVVHDDLIVTKRIEGDDENSVENDWHGEVPHTNQLDLAVSKYRTDTEDGSVHEQINGSDKEDEKLIDEKENDVNVLEQALKEEKAAHTALYIELEKERNAAATAADEAMGMISRLQEEKASIEMQARQYQRMIEEKYAYDAEEMNILKEILLRREREKYVLEKEVENYKLVILGGEQSGKGVREMQEEYGLKESPALDSDDDPLLMLREISESIRKKESSERASKISNSDDVPVEFRNDTAINVDHDDVMAGTLPGCEMIRDKLVLIGKELPNELVESQPGEQHVEKQESGEDGRNGEADSSKHDDDTPVVDVHVVGNELSAAKLISDNSSLATSNQNDMSQEEFVVPSNADSNNPFFMDDQFEITRRRSDIPSRSPPLVSKVNFFLKEEESSLSAIDFERLKIENEVELLRDKLKGRTRRKGEVEFFRRA